MNSRRAAILAEVLEYINCEDWERRDGFLVFGKSAFEAYEEGSHEEESSIDRAGRAMRTNVLENRGQRELDGRTSLRQPPNDNTVAELKVLIEMAMQRQIPTELIESLGGQLEKNCNVADAVDAILARQAISELDRMVAKVVGFDRLDFAPPSLETAEYVNEAHRCDLFGLKISTAVLCRAVLEHALQKQIDPDRMIHRTKMQTESYISKLLSAAVDKGLLDDSRKRAGEDIKDAGNYAVHNLIKFKREYAARTSELVDNTRKILEDLGNRP